MRLASLGARHLHQPGLLLQCVPGLWECCAHVPLCAVPIQILFFQHKLSLTLLSVHKWTLGLFASFILLCGMTHTMNLFKSNSNLAMNLLALVKILCAIVSIVTMCALLRVIPAVRCARCAVSCLPLS